MRHSRRTKHFGRKTTALKALWRGLMVNLIEHGRITTTVDRAKELRRHIEPAITLGKKADLATRRLLISRIANEKAVDTLVSDISKRFKDRAGGYTRIIKIGRRPGDTAEMAFIEFVDYDWQAVAGVKGETKAKADTKEAKKTASKSAKATSKVVAAKKKTAKKGQKKSRAAARA